MLVDVAVIEVCDLRGAEHERGARLATRGMDGHGPTRGVVHYERPPGLAVQRQGGDVDAEVLDVVGLRAERQRPHTRVCAVGADDHVEPASGTRGELRRDPVGVLIKRGHRVAELEFHLVGNRGAQDLREVAARQLDIAGFGPGSHVDPAHHAAAGVDEHHVANASISPRGSAP